ncbi:MAG: hypothetical protein ACJ796_20660 [Gemmatimonadaceae bacterium]
MTSTHAAPATSLPLGAYAIAALGAGIALTTRNPVQTTASILALFALTRLLWRPGEPAVLLFAAGFQWLQVATPVFIADFQGLPISLTSYFPKVELAIWLGLAGVLSLSVGMRLGVRKLPPPITTEVDEQLRTLSVDRLFALYIAWASFAAVLPYLVWRLLPIAQLLFAIGSLKWVFYILLGYATLRRRSKVIYFALATVIEFVAGIGFFSGFKTVFLICALVILSGHVRVNLRMLLAGTVVAAVLLLSGLGWMSIRDEYRAFLNQGTGKQVVLVSPTEQVTEFAGLVSNLEPEDLRGSVERMFQRLAYVDYFAAVLDYVPRQRPFENGALLWRSLKHILVPRFLDPSKDILESDSEITMRYTGLSVASADQGTSIGIGYMAEGYVDFGAYGMLILVLICGFTWGKMYSWLLSHAGISATGFALGTTLLIDASQFEIAEIKLLGGMVAEFLVLAIVLRFLMPGLHRWLARNPRADAGSTFSPENTSLDPATLLGSALEP